MKAAFISFFGHSEAVKQAVNLTLTCYCLTNIALLSWYGHCVRKQLPIYTFIRHAATLSFIWSHDDSGENETVTGCKTKTIS